MMTWNDLEEKGFHAVYADIKRGDVLITIFLYNLKAKQGYYRVHVVSLDTKISHYVEPSFTQEYDTLFEVKISLTIEHLIPVTKLDWRGQ